MRVAALALTALAMGAQSKFWQRPASGLQADCTLRYMGWYYYDPVRQNSTMNFAWASDPTLIAQSHQASPPIQIFYDVSGIAIDMSNVHAFALRADWQSALSSAWQTTIAPLTTSGIVVGFFLGDEIVSHGLPYDDLVSYASFMRSLWADAVIYYNEGHGASTRPARQSPPRRAQRARGIADAFSPCRRIAPCSSTFAAITEPKVYTGPIPADVDWISSDYYALDSTAWTYPRDTLYPKYIFSRMNPSQCAILLPGSYGSRSGSMSVSEYDAFMTQVATNFFDWAQKDARVIGVNPWYWTPLPNMPSSFNPYDVSTSELKTTSATWANIGRKILAM